MRRRVIGRIGARSMPAEGSAITDDGTATRWRLLCNRRRPSAHDNTWESHSTGRLSANVGGIFFHCQPTTTHGNRTARAAFRPTSVGSSSLPTTTHGNRTARAAFRPTSVGSSSSRAAFRPTSVRSSRASGLRVRWSVRRRILCSAARRGECIMGADEAPLAPEVCHRRPQGDTPCLLANKCGANSPTKSTSR